MPPRPHPIQRRTPLRIGVLLLALSYAPATSADPKPPTDPLLIGVYALAPEQVVDGDTIRLPDGAGSIRILGLDCEETFKDERHREAAAADFAAYAKAMRGDEPRPVKYGTPAGEAASAYLKALVACCKTMRLERDRVGGRDRGTYGRLLAHVYLVKDDGTRIHVAENLIRAGHSPYFVKYGRSARFHALFSLAQDQARKAGRGIWGPSGPACYPDYAERLTWWTARMGQVARWKAVASKPDHVTLGAPDAGRKLTALIGKEAVVFGLFDRELRVRQGDRRIFLLSHERRRGFPLVVFDVGAAKALDERETFHSMYVTVRGKVTLYKGTPQMVIVNPEQVRTP